MASGYHLDLNDYSGAEALTIEARELATQENFLQSVSQTGIDLILNYCRRGDIGRAQDLFEEVIQAVKTDPSGPHVWLLPMRLGQAKAELALAEHHWRNALAAADDTFARARAVGRPKYESLAHVSRGKAFIGLGRKREAIEQFQAAVAIARRIADPAVFLNVAGAFLAAEAEEELAVEAYRTVTRIHEALPDAAIRHRFQSSDAVRLVYRLTEGAKQHNE